MPLKGFGNVRAQLQQFTKRANDRQVEAIKICMEHAKKVFTGLLPYRTGAMESSVEVIMEPNPKPGHLGFKIVLTNPKNYFRVMQDTLVPAIAPAGTQQRFLGAGSQDKAAAMTDPDVIELGNVGGAFVSRFRDLWTDRYLKFIAEYVKTGTGTLQ